jgi:hypothetical protein
MAISVTSKVISQKRSRRRWRVTKVSIRLVDPFSGGQAVDFTRWMLERTSKEKGRISGLFG